MTSIRAAPNRSPSGRTWLSAAPMLDMNGEVAAPINPKAMMIR
jgi:hypothetical protein